MYVLCTQSGAVIGVPYNGGAVLEIPHEYYTPGSMTRLGPNLTRAQQSALVLWSTSHPGWPVPINVE